MIESRYEIARIILFLRPSGDSNKLYSRGIECGGASADAKKMREERGFQRILTLLRFSPLPSEGDIAGGIAKIARFTRAAFLRQEAATMAG